MPDAAGILCHLGGFGGYGGGRHGKAFQKRRVCGAR
jgi:hypothetical protein